MNAHIQIETQQRLKLTTHPFELLADSGVLGYNLSDEHVYVFWMPDNGAYRSRRLVALGEPLASETIAGLSIDTNDLV